MMQTTAVVIGAGQAGRTQRWPSLRLLTPNWQMALLGMPVLRTRASTYIHGAAADSRALASHLHSYLGSRHR